MRASDHGAAAKCGSSAGHGLSAGLTQTCTFESPEIPTWAYPVTGIGWFDFTDPGTLSVAANVLSGLSMSLLPPA